jgi:hypothetical protein
MSLEDKEVIAMGRGRPGEDAIASWSRATCDLNAHPSDFAPRSSGASLSKARARGAGRQGFAGGW